MLELLTLRELRKASLVDNILAIGNPEILIPRLNLLTECLLAPWIIFRLQYQLPRALIAHKLGLFGHHKLLRAAILDTIDCELRLEPLTKNAVSLVRLPEEAECALLASSLERSVGRWPVNSCRWSRCRCCRFFSQRFCICSAFLIFFSSWLWLSGSFLF